MVRVSGELLSHGGGSDARCVDCGAVAVGPCARCHDPVCGDCCVLTTGSANVFAICRRCERRGGKSLRSGWGLVALWLALPLGALLVALAILQWAFGSTR